MGPPMCNCTSEVALRLPGTTDTSAPLWQPRHHFVELLEVAIADLDGAAGVAVVDGHGKTKCIADALLQRDRVGIFCLAAAGGPRLLRLAFRHALFMCQRLGLADVQPL